VVSQRKLSFDACPDDPEDTAELYLLHSLSAAEAECFEEHYMGCENCMQALSAAEDYICSIRAAGLRLSRSRLHLVRPKPPTIVP
jgi:hypothetical protein